MKATAGGWRCYNRESNQINVLTESLDRHVTGFAWHPDSKRIAFTADDRGRQIAHLIAVTGGGTRILTQASRSSTICNSTADGKTLVYTEQSGASPVEIFKAVSGGGTPTALTHLNDDLLSAYDLRPLEEFTTNGAEGVPVHSFLLKPPGSTRGKVSGVDADSRRAAGLVGRIVDLSLERAGVRRGGVCGGDAESTGSEGYGTQFTDEINGDWGGRAYDDVMAVTDYVAELPYVDGDRMAAAGGSYGGYMVDWILGHTNRFKALISHAGVYDLRSETGATEELWFPAWEFKGMPWEQPELYEKWSPSTYAKEFKTPTLVIHGELDFRVPYTQGLQLFTALEAQKVPSKLIVFPDEGHWVLKPQNSLLWYRNFIDWITEWTAKK